MVKPGESKTFDLVITTPNSALSTQQFGVIWAEVQGSTNFAYSTEITYISFSVNIILLIVLLLSLRRYPRERRETKEREMRDKNEWREEKRRRTELSKRVNP